MVHRRGAERFLQLPRCASGRARRQDRHRFRGRTGRRAAPHLPRAARGGVPVRQCAARRAASAAAIASSSTCRWCPRRSSPCRPARASAPCIRWCSAAFRRTRSAIASRMPARRCVHHGRRRAGAAAARRAQGRSATRRSRAAARRREGHRASSAPGGRCAMRPGRDHLVARPWRGAAPIASRSGSMPSIRCSCSTPPARPASPRASSIPAPATCSGAKLTTQWVFDLQRRRRVLVHGRCRLGHRPQLRRLRSAGARRHGRHVRRRADLSRRRALLEDLPGRTASPFSTPRRPRSAR